MIHKNKEGGNMKTKTSFSFSLMFILAVLSATQAVAAGNHDRNVYFGQTHSHTSWSIDAYLIGNHLAGPEEKEIQSRQVFG